MEPLLVEGGGDGPPPGEPGDGVCGDQPLPHDRLQDLGQDACGLQGIPENL